MAANRHTLAAGGMRYFIMVVGCDRAGDFTRDPTVSLRTDLRLNL